MEGGDKTAELWGGGGGESHNVWGKETTVWRVRRDYMIEGGYYRMEEEEVTTG